jgi:hypothetical protein
MFCATLLVTGQCLFVCEGLLSEFNHAWNWPASVRWDNNTQALVDDYGPLPQLYRRGVDVIWRTPAEPTYCDNVQRSPPIPPLKPEQLSPAGRGAGRPCRPAATPGSCIARRAGGQAVANASCRERRPWRTSRATATTKRTRRTTRTIMTDPLPNRAGAQATLTGSAERGPGTLAICLGGCSRLAPAANATPPGHEPCAGSDRVAVS